MFREEEVMYHVKSRQEQKIELIRFICEQIGSIEGVDVKVSTNGLQNWYSLKYSGHSFYLDLTNKSKYGLAKINIKTTINNVPYVKNREDKEYFMRYLKNEEELTFNVKSYKDALDKLVSMKEELIKLSIESKVKAKEVDTFQTEKRALLKESLKDIISERDANTLLMDVKYNTGNEETPYRLMYKDFSLSNLVYLAQVWSEGGK